ncbi:hypothetical protein BDN72DRAFT_906213 [Pluteus cervinus]|uniref:Uncharacterized protein n=1 Tax=Pluteus cervinus TaxID=181527 RepID=A0ACD3A016_9AGAR|nr:hypothetical protein BDN72DRAFT_906213 [Pluteus cervinus]
MPPSRVTVRGYRRFLPPITNRIGVPRGRRDLSPDDTFDIATYRKVFVRRTNPSTGDRQHETVAGGRDTQRGRPATLYDHQDERLHRKEGDPSPIKRRVRSKSPESPERSDDEHGEDGHGEGEDSSDSESDVQACDRPMSPGKLSRPNDGGYSLEGVLKWKKERYNMVQKRLHKIAADKLDVRVLIKNQHAEALQAYLEEAVKVFPFLGKYPGAWPAEDFASIYVKNQRLKISKKKGKMRAE